MTAPASPSACPRTRRAAWRCLLGALAGLLIGLAAPAQAKPLVWQRVDQITLDDPHAAVAWVDRELPKARAAGDKDTEFWLLMGGAYAQNQLEDGAREDARLREARQLLASWPGATQLQRVWLEAGLVQQSVREKPVAELSVRIADLRQQAVALGAQDLICELDSQALWAMVYAGARDEAWAAGEAVERCAHAVGNLDLEVSALNQLGGLSSEVSGKIAGAGQGEDYFQRALDVLGDRPSRFARSLIEWQFGNALVFSRQPEAAREHYQRALALSLDLHDDAGIGAAMVKVGELTLAAGNPERALRLAEEARQILEAQQNQMRLVPAFTLTVRALTLLHRPEVLAAIEQARTLDGPGVITVRRAELAEAMAAGYASQGQYGRAYAELQRANLLKLQNKEGLRDTQMLRLQARYEGARREAENAELRRRSETAQLQLVAQDATRRALWAALAAMLLLLAAAAFLGVRGWRKRRHLAELALRDDLTGLPNRRAIHAAGQAQLAQARQFGEPFCVALIDLDHFKQVNDRLGHAAGDAVLRVLSHAAGRVLRGRDRLGRLGGEEFLLLMPGTEQDELQPVFDRLRNALVNADIPGLPRPHGVRFSMGGAAWTPQMGSLDVLIEAADQALYMAKAAGRDQLAVAEAPPEAALAAAAAAAGPVTRPFAPPAGRDAREPVEEN